MEKKYWFKRRRYGYGWTPVTTEGWLVISGFVILVIGGSLVVGPREDLDPFPQLWYYLGYIALLTAGLFIITTRKGPTPKWRWGKTPQDDPEEDI